MKAPSSAGYSGTLLSKKLGIKAASVVMVDGAPADYEELLAPLPAGVTFRNRAGRNVDIAHVFVTQKAQLAERLKVLRSKLKPDAVVWISWPKKASKVATTITEDVIRELALPLGFVDIKVCAVSDVWSGLKLVVRKELR